jgi:serine-type D-Ala-D-Ala endopeptidase (penicillin-binding protein 7)
MTLNHLIALLTAISLNANPSPHAIPTVLAPLPVAQNVATAPEAPIKKRPESLGIATTAKSALVVDLASGSVLYAKEANVDRPIASLTKLMTSMVVMDQGLKDDEMITVGASDIERQGSAVFQAGDTMTRREALHALLVASANEIANAFVRTSEGGSETFLEAMRVKADALGLSHAAFLDPTGINPKNRASAVDVALMMRSALAYPEIRDFSESEAFDLTVTNGGKSRVVHVKSTNLLLSSYLNEKPYRIVAGKTGSLPEAGYCLAQATKNGNGDEVIAVVLGSGNHFARFQEVKGLTAWAFDTFAWK